MFALRFAFAGMMNGGMGQGMLSPMGMMGGGTGAGANMMGGGAMPRFLGKKPNAKTALQESLQPKPGSTPAPEAAASSLAQAGENVHHRAAGEPSAGREGDKDASSAKFNAEVDAPPAAGAEGAAEPEAGEQRGGTAAAPGAAVADAAVEGAEMNDSDVETPPPNPQLPQPFIAEGSSAPADGAAAAAGGGIEADGAPLKSAASSKQIGSQHTNALVALLATGLLLFMF